MRGALHTMVVVAFVLASANADAAIVTLDNGVTGDGHVSVPVDEFGVFGWLLAPPQKDSYDPPGAEGPNYTTYTAGVYVFATTSDGKRTAAALNSFKFWNGYLEPGNNQADGLAGDRVVSRVIDTPNTSTGPTEVTSAFSVQESPTGPFRLTFVLRQVLAFDPATTSTTLEQTYVVTNAGTLAMQLAFYVHEDPALPFVTNDWNDDIVGVGAGRCYVYAREAANPAYSIALSDGGSTVPVTAYYAGKCAITPSAGSPAFESTQDSNLVFSSYGLPVSWRNELATVGANVVGESPATPTAPAVVPSACSTIVGDGALGHEYRFPLAPGASETIRVRRHWGTIAITCPPPAMGTCGDGVVDPASEQCDDGGDSLTCNSNCTLLACGDGYRNALAEACDEGGETATCNADCTLAACGDGQVNAAAGEDCETTDALCDATCKYKFSIGGGCGGCATGGATPGLWPLVLALLLRRRWMHRGRALR